MAHYTQPPANPEDERDEHNEQDNRDPVSPAGTLTLETLMSALHLVMDQQAAEASLRGVNGRPDVAGAGSSTSAASPSSHTANVFSVAASSTLAMPSPALSASSTFAEVSNSSHTVEAAPQPTAPIAQPIQPAPRWYCVSRGHAIGVFAGWLNVSPLVTGVPGSIYQRHATFSAALAAFLEAADNGTVRIIL